MQFIKRFAEISIDDVATVGGKSASLGEMYSALSGLGVGVPNGYAITAEAYRCYLRHNRLEDLIRGELAEFDSDDPAELADVGGRVRAGIVHGEMPADLRDEIIAAYEELGREYHEDKPDVAVRSSATAEDLPTVSFAGQQDTYLNIAGTRNLISTCKWVFASLFTDRVIAYRMQNGVGHLDVALAVAVQKMVRSDLASSGVMFTLDTESGFRNAVFITSAYGLGENLVQGTVNPDEFYVFKPTLQTGHRAIIKRRLGSKEIKMIYAAEHLAGIHTKNVPVHPEDRDRFSIADEDVLTLARYAVTIEDHYSKRHGHPMPMDIEWAKDGRSGQLYVVQARPETVLSRAQGGRQEHFRLLEQGPLLTTGKSVGRRIASGDSRVILEAMDMEALEDGEILVTDITDPDWEPVLKRAAAIVTNRGGRTCHAAIVAREFGIPAVVGCNDATAKIHEGQPLTVSCADGDTGYVYEGHLAFDREVLDLEALPRASTRLMLRLGNPEQAFEAAFLPSAGVGLAPLDSVVASSIGVHPRAVLEPAVLDREARLALERVSAGYASPREFFVNRLAEGVGTIAAAFHPRPVMVCLSGFQSSDYALLIGGAQFEPPERNPMLGFRGAARYFSPEFADSFALECAALLAVRETLGLDNLALLVPYVRSPEEGRRVVELMAEQGLVRGQGGLQVHLMCELPTNALQADRYLEHFDGMVIGAESLTQLTLGMDAGNDRLTAPPEQDPAVGSLIGMTIEACKRRGKYVAYCGPAHTPALARFLVERGVDSLAAGTDRLLPTLRVVAAAEAELEAERR